MLSQKNYVFVVCISIAMATVEYWLSFLTIEIITLFEMENRQTQVIF